MAMPPPRGVWKVGNVELRAHLDLGFEHDPGGHPRGSDHLHVIGRGGTPGRSFVHGHGGDVPRGCTIPVMDHRSLWAPWRLAYLEEYEEAKQASEQAASETTFLSAYWEDPAGDLENHVVLRTDEGMILLNRYPYANGHLLVALGEPRPSLLDYGTAHRAEFWSLVERGIDLMQKVLDPDGINFGINQGAAAGAGVPGHLHGHLVPRWRGDTNAMTTVGGTRVIPASLEDMAERYRSALKQV
ncbi:MAG: hypothetical protein CMJ36_05485 [Phycisphaerae bacterium]|nr:hypothetical protein [Phycisphaerae bacterium]